MAFRFSTDDPSIQRGIRRIAQKEAAAALGHLQADLVADPQAVHEVRKSAKKLRGLIGLVRPVFPHARAENAALRDAARQIAALRDAEVMCRTFEGLADVLPDEAQGPLRAALDARKEAVAPPETLTAAAQAVKAEFEELQKRCRGWKIRGKDFAALEPGLAETWAKARKGVRRARKACGDESLPAAPFHSWRRRVKQHWYQARLLQPIWPEIMDPHVAQADALGELLGAHNDLDVLLTTLSDDPALAGNPALESLETVVIERRRALAAEAVALGGRLFAEPADALTSRWGHWFRLWRG